MSEFKNYVKLPVKTRAKKMLEAFSVETLEGTMQGSPGDYLVEGIEGEHYPCKCDIFENTYEEVSF